PHASGPGTQLTPRVGKRAGRLSPRRLRTLAPVLWLRCQLSEQQARDTSRRLLPRRSRRESPEPRLQLLNLGLLCFDRLDQQGRQAGVVDALRFLGSYITRHHFRDDLFDILGNHPDFVLAIAFALVGYTLELFYLLQRSCERLYVGLRATGAADSPGVGER